MADESLIKPGERVRSFMPAEAAWIEGDHPTANPDGVTVSNYDYVPKTQEEKADLLDVDMVQVTDEAPYPDGSPLVQTEEDRLRYLSRMHSPQELVQASDMAEQQERNLRAGGSVETAEVMSIARDVT